MAHFGRRLSSVRERAHARLDEVMAGQSVTSARDLFVLIHEVNPTGRALGRREVERRYAIKRRLQSLLVQCFAEDVGIEPCEQEGIVLLRHKYSDLAATHAVVADLDEDARAWVQMQLDLGVVGRAWAARPEDSEPAPGGRPGRAPRRRGPKDHKDGASSGLRDGHDGEVAASLAEGRAALASFDYEAARAAFERARALAPEAAWPTAALLDLLVNHLGLDEEALGLAGSVPVSAQSAISRRALAMAAARTGERERAEAWAKHLDGDGAAEVHRTLASAAIRAGDLGYAEAALEHARRNLAADPERLSVERQLGEARAAAVGEEEAALARALAAADLGRAGELARAILARHPGSAAARATLKEIAGRERSERLRWALDEARSSAGRAEVKQAREALLLARELGASAEQLADLERAIDQGEQRARSLARARAIEGLAGRLGRAQAPGELEEVLVDYLRLDADARAEVRGLAGAPALPWLDDLAPIAGPRVRQAVAAAVAAAAAVRLLDAGELDGSAAALARHRSLVRTTPLGRALLARLKQARDRREHERVRDLLARVRAALGARDLASAKMLLEAVHRDGLPPELACDLAKLRAELASAKEHRARMDLVDQFRAGHRWPNARRLLLDRLRESQDPAEMALLGARLREVDEQARREHVRIDCVPPPGSLASDCPEMGSSFAFSVIPQVGLLSDQNSVLVLSLSHGLLLARVVDVDSGEIRRLLGWTIGQAISAVSVGLDHGRLYVADFYFQYGEISCSDWLPSLECQIKPDAASAQALDGCIPLPEEGVVWVRSRRLVAPHTRPLHLFDLRRGCIIDIAEADEGEVVSVLGSRPAMVAWLCPGTAVFLVSPRGQDECFIAIAKTEVPLAVALGPSGEGYALLIGAEQESELGLTLVLTDKDGMAGHRLALPGLPNRRVGIATVVPKRLLCILYRDTASGEPRTSYVRAEPDGSPRFVADVAVPGLLTVFQDDAANTAVAMRKTARGMSFDRLEGMPAELTGGYRDVDLPSLEVFVGCTPPPEPGLESGIRFHAHYTLKEAAKEFSDHELEVLAVGVDGASRAVSTYHMLRVRKCHERADRLLDLMLKQGTRNFFVRVALAEREVNAGRWLDEAEAADLEAAALQHGASAHVLHLRAVALLRQNRTGEVIRALAGHAQPGPCRLDALLALAEALEAERSGQPASRGDSGKAPDQPSVAALVHAIFAADRALAAGDRARARALLDVAWIRDLSELQSMARLVEIYLGGDELEGAVLQFRAAALLSRLLETLRYVGRHHQLWLCENTYSCARVEGIITLAGERLKTFTWSGCPIEASRHA